jgi:cell division protease FtsH
MVYTMKYLLATMRTLLGGRVAEQVFFNEVSSGAAADIKHATEIARRMVRDWGMGESIGFVYYGEDDRRPGGFDWPTREYSDKTAEVIDAEVKKILDAAYADASRTIVENREKLEAIAEALLQYETLTGDEVNALFRGESLERTSVSDLLDSAAAEGTIGIARPVEAEPEPKPKLGEGPLPQPG